MQATFLINCDPLEKRRTLSIKEARSSYFRLRLRYWSSQRVSIQRRNIAKWGKTDQVDALVREVKEACRIAKRGKVWSELYCVTQSKLLLDVFPSFEFETWSGQWARRGAAGVGVSRIGNSTHNEARPVINSQENCIKSTATPIAKQLAFMSSSNQRYAFHLAFRYWQSSRGLTTIQCFANWRDETAPNLQSILNKKHFIWRLELLLPSYT